MPLPHRPALVLLTLFAVLVTATVPYFCATGWCCAKHEEQAQVREAEHPSCCAAEAAVEQPTGDSCCNTGSPTGGDTSCDQGCATGCCKLAATAYVLTLPLNASFVPPVSQLVANDVLNTGIELTNYIPQPPRALSA